MKTKTTLEGHDAFPVPAEHQWKKDRFIQAGNHLVGTLRRVADEVQRDLNRPYASAHTEDPYTSLAERLISTVIQAHGNTSTHLRLLASYGHLVDQTLDAEQRDYDDLADAHRRLTFLAQDVVARPTSKKAREALSQALDAAT